MYKYIAKVDGMMCGMCESHMNDAVRNNFTVKKVKSSRKKAEVLIESEEKIDIEALRKVIVDTGYTAGDIVEEEK